MDKEIAGWHYVQDYYPVLINIISTIRQASHIEDYSTCFKDLEQVFIHWRREMEKNKESLERIIKIEKQLPIINQYIIQAQKIQSKPIPEYIKDKKIKKINTILKSEIYTLELEIFSALSDVGAFMPKKKVNERLPIYGGATE